MMVKLWWLKNWEVGFKQKEEEVARQQGEEGEEYKERVFNLSLISLNE